MTENTTMPDSVVAEFLNSSGDPVRLIDLGADFLDENGVESARFSDAFKIAIQKKNSKAGNAFYDYSQNGLSLPDGLSTFLKVEGAIIPLGKIRPSKNGYPTREGQAEVLIKNIMYKATAYLTESKIPYYVKIVLTKIPDRSKNVSKAQKAPRGGKII